MRRPLALLAAALLLAPAPLRAQSCAQADLSSQFPDAPGRDQGTVGNCHSFAAVALLEAALRRASGRAVALSEADLFARTTATHSDFILKAEKAESRGDMLQFKEAVLSAQPREGGHVPDGLDLALAQGVADARTYSFDDFLNGYLSAKPVIGRQILAEGMRPEHVEKVFPSDAVVSAAPERLHLAAAYSSPAGAVELQKELLGVNADARFARISAEREALRQELQGMRVDNQWFDTSRPISIAQAERAQALLCRGIPVAVSIDLRGLKGWGHEGKSPFPLPKPLTELLDKKEGGPVGHAFVLTGLRTDADGRVIFQTRNSWSGTNPELRASDMAAAWGVTALLAPGE